MKHPFSALLSGMGVSISAVVSSVGSEPIAASAGVSLDLPAVEKFNGKIDYLGGWMESNEGHNFSGSFSFPVGERFGIQGDALYTRVIGGDSKADFFAGGAHFFWRNPSRALAGVFVAGESGAVQYSLHVGIESEYYFPQFTVGLTAGVGHLRYDQPVSFFDTEQTRFVGSISASWYATDELMVSLGYANLFENHLGQALIEYQTPLRGLSFTVDAGMGSHDFDYLLLGVRYYFGRNKPLKLRHREDDPTGLLRRVMNSLGLVGADFGRQAEKATGGTGGWGGFGETLIEVDREILKPGSGEIPPTPPTSITSPELPGT